MKNKNLLFLGLFLLFNLFSITLVQAQLVGQASGAYAGVLGNELSNTFVKSVFNITSPVTLGDLIVVIAVFLMIIFAFQDMISMFSLFSNTTSWMISIAMGLIGALTGWIVNMAIWMLNLLSVLGTLSIFVAVGISFILFALVHIGFGGWASKWFEARKKGMEEAKTEIATIQAIKFFKATGKEIGKVN